MEVTVCVGQIVMSSVFDLKAWDKAFGLHKQGKDNFEFDDTGQAIGGDWDVPDPHWDAIASASADHTWATDQGWGGHEPLDYEFHPETGAYSGGNNAANHVQDWAKGLEEKHGISLVNELGEPNADIYSHHGLSEEPIGHNHITEYIKAKTGEVEKFPGVIYNQDLPDQWTPETEEEQERLWMEVGRQKDRELGEDLKWLDEKNRRRNMTHEEYQDEFGMDNPNIDNLIKNYPSQLHTDLATTPKELKKKKYIEPDKNPGNAYAKLIKQGFGVGTARGAGASQRLGQKKAARFNQRFKGMSGATNQAERRAQNQKMRTMNRNPGAMKRQRIQQNKFQRQGGNVAGGPMMNSLAKFIKNQIYEE